MEGEFKDNCLRAVDCHVLRTNEHKRTNDK